MPFIFCIFELYNILGESTISTLVAYFPVFNIIGDMDQTSKLQKAAVDLILKYFGQSTAEVYAKFFNGENDSEITNSLTEIMTDYIGEAKAKAEISKIVEGLAV